MERPRKSGRLNELMHQHAEYGEGILSPYTAIVSPSGIGKSLAVKQLADVLEPGAQRQPRLFATDNHGLSPHR